MLRKIDDAPVFKAVIKNDNDGIRRVSLVNDPAIEIEGFYFSNEYAFKVVKEKMRIVGPALVPDKKIYREHKGKGYYIVFTKEIIQELVGKFNKSNNNRSINDDHTPTMVNSYIDQNWIVEDLEYDKSKLYGFSCPVGTWFIELKVDDVKYWEDEVKANNKYSFSIEGLFDLEVFDFSKQIEMATTYPNVHESCKCEIVDDEWITAEGCCDYCEELAAEHNSKNFSNIIQELSEEEILDLVKTITDEV